MFPSLDFATGGGDMNLGDNSSATGGNTSLSGISGAMVNGTVKDKSWLFSTGKTSEKTGYYVGAAVAVAALVGVAVFAIKGRK